MKFEDIEDIVEFFKACVKNLEEKKIDVCKSTLEEIVLRSAKDNLAYVDNRRDAKKRYGIDFWEQLIARYGKDFERILNNESIKKSVLYSKSELFPDFLFKVRYDERLRCGSILELKDSKSGSIASFNSTIPTTYKTLEEIDIINGGRSLVSKIAKLMDSEVVEEIGFDEYYTFQRRCFYLVRTHRDNTNRVKVSIVDGSFFETVPREHLIYQMFLQILREHIEKKNIEIDPKVLKEVEKVLSYITDQTIIAGSKLIEKASIKPRLRIMAEVHPEGNPHSKHYPIRGRTFNLIVKKSRASDELEQELSKLPIRIFSIHHKRNGEHVVFQYDLFCKNLKD